MTSKPSYSQSIFSVNSTTGGQLKCMKESTFIRESWIQVRTFCEPSFHFAPRFPSPLPLLSFFLFFFPSLLLFFLFVLRPTLSQRDRDRAYDQFRAYPLGMSFKKRKKTLRVDSLPPWNKRTSVVIDRHHANLIEERFEFTFRKSCL